MSEHAVSVPHRLIDALGRWPLIELSRAQALVRFPGVGRILVNGDGIERRQPEIGRCAADLDFLDDTAAALGELLAGRIPMHASVVSIDGNAVAFSGPGPIGKSTIATALSLRGHELVTDAVATVTIGADGVPYVAPRPGGVLLWPHAVECLELDPEVGEVVRAGLEVRRFGGTSGISPATAPARLAAVFFVDRRPEAGYEVVPRHGFDAVTMLQRSPWHRMATKALALEPATFRWATQIASSVQVAGLVIPRRRSDPLRVAELVLEVLEGSSS